MKQSYSVIRVKLPTFAVLLLRHLVRKANARDRSKPKWTVSLLLERWLLHAMTVKEMSEAATKSPEFKRAAEAWLKTAVNKRRSGK